MLAVVFVLLYVVGELPFSEAAAPTPTDASFAPGIYRPPLPPMGWRSWNWFACNIDQQIMGAQTEAMAATPHWANKSLIELGYNHIGLDDCWQSCTGPKGSFHNAKTGVPIINKTKFPSLSDMAAKAKTLGLSPGFYGNNCRCHQGEIKEGVTHYVQDVALTLKEGFTGTKIDSCGNQRDMAEYATQFAAGNATMLVESCGNGPKGSDPKFDLPPQPAYLEQLRTTCPYSFYRVSMDLGPQFYSCVYNLNRALPFLDAKAPLSRPGCWAYPDMAMVGVSIPRPSGRTPYDPHLLNALEWRSHYAMWAVTSSPLILGFDLTNATLLREVWHIVANEELLAVSQTWQGHPGRLVANSTEYKVLDVVHGSPGISHTTELLPSWQVWAKPVAGGAVAVLLVRVWEGSANATLSFSLTELFGGAPAPSSVRVRDVFAHSNNGTAAAAVSFDLAALPEHGSTFVVLTPA
jgi:alpha-galactosidase